MTTIPPERVEKARWWLKEFMPLGGGMLEEVIAILDDYAALRAENELGKMLIDDLTRDLNEENARAEKAEAELEKAKSDLIDESKRRAAIAKSLQAHQDQLAKQAPLVKTALQPKVVSREWVGELVEVARWGDKDGGYARVKSRLCSELGVVVGD